MNKIFEDRDQAGELLAAQLKRLSKADRQNALILALPRGGVPVARKVAEALNIGFDVLIVRKIGHPLQHEYGIGAITEEGVYWMDPEAVGLSEVAFDQLDKVIEEEKKEIARRIVAYRGGRPLPSLEGKTVILVDDGFATGVTARVAAKYVKAKNAKKVILAVPVCAASTATRLRSEFDEVICLNEESLFMSVGQFYSNFTQVSDQEVMDMLPGAQAVGPSSSTEESVQKNKEIVIPTKEGLKTKGLLTLPKPLLGLVIFAHGSGSSRFSSRNQQVANHLNQHGIGTLLFDLLTEEESQDRANVFDILLLAERLISATSWVRQQKFGKKISIGYFGASTGAGAALWAASALKSDIAAVVSRGGRPDLAIPKLKDVTAPTLLIVGDRDTSVIPLNEKALKYLKNGRLTLVPGATHLFEEPGTLQQASDLAVQWFEKYLVTKKSPDLTATL